MQRKQVYLTTGQIAKILRAARKAGLRFSEMLRRIIDNYFDKHGGEG